METATTGPSRPKRARRWKPTRPWTTWEQAGVALGYGLLTIAGAILPIEVLVFLSRLGTRALVALSRDLRDSLDSNARRLLGPGATPQARARLGREVMASVARHAIELVAARPGWPGIDAIESKSGTEYVREALARGKGVIGVTLHMGNYEVGAMLVGHYDRPVAIVFTHDPDGLFDRIRSRRRRKHSLREIPIGDSPFFTLEVLRVLRQNGFALVAGDIAAPGQGSDVHDFLGGRAHFPRLPARLALASGAPVLPCFVVRGPRDRYRLEVAAPIFPEECADAADLTRRLVAVFEGVVRRHPEQWLVLHRFWEESPSGKPALLEASSKH